MCPAGYVPLGYTNWQWLTTVCIFQHYLGMPGLEAETIDVQNIIKLEPYCYYFLVFMADKKFLIDGLLMAGSKSKALECVQYSTY